MRSMVAAVTTVFVLVALTARAQDDAVTRGFEALANSRTAEAAAAVEELRGQDTPDIRLLRALVAQHQGEHGTVLDELEDAGADPRVVRLRDAARAAARGLGDAQIARSEHFVVRYAAGADQVMIDEALGVLEKSYVAVGQDLGLYPDTAVLVDIYPTAAAFSSAAGLPPEAVANETVGLCRWDRLLITSPAAAPFGYPWADTLCHEYTHLAVNRLGRGRVPVWLHEGIASFEARRWRGETFLVMDPYATELLLEALEGEDLVTLAEIGDCLACLDGKDRVHLAFAQVHFMVDHLIRARGLDGLYGVLDAVGSGARVQDAIGAVWGSGFEAFEDSWQKTAREGLSARDTRAGWVTLGLDATVDDPGDTPPADSVLLGTTEGADLARLGDLLLARGQLRPALLEYRKADKALGEVSPSLACKRGHVLQMLGEPGRALTVVDEARVLYPHFEPLHVHAASAQMQLGQSEDALRSLHEAVLLNPFDPRIYAWRMELLEHDPDAAAAARRSLETLSGELR